MGQVCNNTDLTMLMFFNTEISQDYTVIKTCELFSVEQYLWYLFLENPTKSGVY